jgi:hypothetical protein
METSGVQSKLGVGMSADAARMSACATMDSTRCQEAQN